MTAERERLREACERGVPWRKWGPYLRESDEGRRAAICDERMHLCFAVGLRQGADNAAHSDASAETDRIYLDNVPTHSYMRVLYKHPPCFDVFVEYAKATPEEILIRITVDNRGSVPVSLRVLPELWFGQPACGPCTASAAMHRRSEEEAGDVIVARHPCMGDYYLQCESPDELLFSDHEARATLRYVLTVQPQKTRRVRLTLSHAAPLACTSAHRFDAVVLERRREAAEFYAMLTRAECDATFSRTFRHACTTALWNKQLRVQESDSLQLSLPSRCRELRLAAWRQVLHVLALARIDSELAFDQLESLLNAQRSLRPFGPAVGVASRQTAVNAWAALLMYRLQSPNRPERAVPFLRQAFHLLSMQRASVEWQGLYAQSMFEMAVELALADEEYEQAAIECYLRLLSAISAVESLGERNDGSAARLQQVSSSSHICGCIRSPSGLLAVCAASTFPDSILRRLPRLARFVHRLTWENGAYGMFEPLGIVTGEESLAAASVDERVVNDLLTRLAEPRLFTSLDPLSECLPRAVVLLRALLCLADCIGDSFSVDFPVWVDRRMSDRRMNLFEIATEVSRRISSLLLGYSRADGLSRSGSRQQDDYYWQTLIRFYERVYCDGCGTSRRTSWAGFIAPLIGLASGYRAFEQPPQGHLKVATAWAGIS